MSTEMRTNIITNQLIQIPELSGMKNKFPVSDFFLRIFIRVYCAILMTYGREQVLKFFLTYLKKSKYKI